MIEKKRKKKFPLSMRKMKKKFFVVILKKLKILAIELEISVIITAQLSRDGSFIDCPAIEDYADFIIKIEDYSTYMKSKCMFFRMMRYDVDDIILPMKFIRKYRCFEHIEI